MLHSNICFSTRTLKHKRVDVGFIDNKKCRLAVGKIWIAH